MLVVVISIIIWVFILKLTTCIHDCHALTSTWSFGDLNSCCIETIVFLDKNIGKNEGGKFRNYLYLLQSKSWDIFSFRCKSTKCLFELMKNMHACKFELVYVILYSVSGDSSFICICYWNSLRTCELC